MHLTVGRVALKQCRRCNGDMEWDGDYWSCLQCSYEDYSGSNHLARNAPSGIQRPPGYIKIRYDGKEPDLEGRILYYRKIPRPGANNATQNDIDALCPYEGCGQDLKVTFGRQQEGRRNMKCKAQHLAYVSIDQEPIGWR